MLEFVTTGDGSKTIFNSEIGENYHSRHGALQESRHVFLKSGLEYFLANKTLTELAVLEVGFGTGLNFLLSFEYCAGRRIRLNYTGIEAYPLSHEMIGQTGYDQFIVPSVWQNFIRNYNAALTNTIRTDQLCQLQIAHCKLSDFTSEDQYDVIYFDAFASARQPEMWTESAIAHTVSFLKPGGVFVTYAITGDLKRALKRLGLKVEKAPGAPGKREMLRATMP
ncbi:MAG: tRNA (5-methylaminomethyl-2-thiouridine)(34)-methyltransferase MnmD [Bacteroidetes bacterium]|nr:tRNA (5-methylaminomethyl-2-thiouridine)(34)-methyltransferase MnmD [Bacteroidota bacterium]